MIFEFSSARQAGMSPAPEWVNKFRECFVKVQLWDRSGVRSFAMLLYDMILDSLSGEDEFNEATFSAREQMLIHFMHEDLYKIRGDGVAQVMDNWLKDSGLGHSREDYEAAVRAIMGFNR